MWFFFLFPASVNQRMVTNVITDGGNLHLSLHLVSSGCWTADNVDVLERYPGVFPFRHDSGFEDNFGARFAGQVITQRAGNVFWIDGGEPQVGCVGK